MGCGALPLSPIDAAAVEVGSSTASPRDPALPSQPPNKTGTFVIIGVIVAVLIFIALIIDVSCYFVNKRGLTYMICSRSSRNKSSGRNGSNKNSALMEGGKEEHNDEKTPLREVTVEFQDASRETPCADQQQQQQQQTAQVDQPSPTLINDDQKELIKDDVTDINNGLKKSASKSSVAKDSPV